MSLSRRSDFDDFCAERRVALESTKDISRNALPAEYFETAKEVENIVRI